MNDKQLQEQLNSLSSLSGGIVFGKEEAWDKLQARMDKKATPKIPLGYWMAAAAVLLVVVCIAPFYFSDNKEVSRNDKEAVAPAITNEPVMQQQDAAPVATTTPRETFIPKQRPRTVHLEDNVPATNAPITTEAVITEIPLVDNVAVNNSPDPIPNMIAPAMRVVHINDIEKNRLPETVNTTNLAQKDAPDDLHKMPVHYINDVLQEEHEIKLLLRENRFSFGRNIFSRPAYNDADPASNTEDGNQPHNLLKNILNTQN